ncbi:MAG TPA: response regulator [Pirellulales bacterium]|nr:response regulator [Pirellulales bacterium]
MIPTSQHQDDMIESGTPTILCIDDDLDVLGAVELRMREFDVNLVRAFDGMEGFGEAVTCKPDVIVMDLDMPYGDGMTMLECFRRDPDTEKTPVIILTGLNDPTLKQRMIDMGANQFLRKPVRFDDLKQELEQFISLRPREHAVPTAADK